MGNRKRYDDSFKEEVLEAVDKTSNISSVCKQYSLPRSTIYDWLKVREEKNSVGNNLDTLSEINMLKMLVGEKELELRMLRNKLK